MDLGVYIHGSSPFYPKTDVSDYIQLAKEYDELGFQTLWFADHLIRTPDPNKSSLFETYTLITALSQHTKKIRFGTMVSPIGFRNLGLFAKMISTIDHLSNGRITVGLGTGWHGKEFDMFGIPFPTLKDRFKELERYIQGLKSLWGEDNVSMESEIKLENAYLNPKPLQEPHPPILIGGGGEKKTLRLVAKYGQMSNFGGTNENIQHKLQVLKQHCQDAQTDFDKIITTTNMALILGKNPEEVSELISNYRNRFVELGLSPPSVDNFGKNRIVGTKNEVLSRIDGLADIGIKEVNFTINDPKTQENLKILVE